MAQRTALLHSARLAPFATQHCCEVAAQGAHPGARHRALAARPRAIRHSQSRARSAPKDAWELRAPLLRGPFSCGGWRGGRARQLLSLRPPHRRATPMPRLHRLQATDLRVGRPAEHQRKPRLPFAQPVLLLYGRHDARAWHRRNH